MWYSIAKLGTWWGDLLLNVILSKVMHYLVLSTQHDGGTLWPLGLGPLAYTWSFCECGYNKGKTYLSKPSLFDPKLPTWFFNDH